MKKLILTLFNVLLMITILCSTYYFVLATEEKLDASKDVETDVVSDLTGWTKTYSLQNPEATVDAVLNIINNHYNRNTDGSSAEAFLSGRANKVLSAYNNTFCAQHNKGMSHAGSPIVSGPHIFTRNMNDYITFENRKGATPYLNTTPTFFYDRCEKGDSEGTKTTASNFNAIKWWGSGSLKSIDNYYGIMADVNPSNVIPYAIAFNDKTSTTHYPDSKTQHGVWSVTGGSAGDYRGEIRYLAGRAVDDYEEQVSQHGQTITITAGSNAGTVLADGSTDTYRVGPFTMSDYAFAYSANVKNLSGKNVPKYKGLIGGIDAMQLTIVDDSGTPKYIDIDGTNAKIVYKDRNGNATSKGDRNRSTGAFTTKIPDAENIYPAPKSTFYIDISRSVAGDVATLQKISTSYRKTETEGQGSVIIVQYAKTTLTMEDTGTKGCGTYYCTNHSPSYASHSTTHSDGGSKTCTYTWDCDDHYSGHGCAGGHTRSGCACGGTTTNADGSVTKHCSGHTRSGCHCSCPGHSATHTSIFKCTHGHEHCNVSKWVADAPTKAYGQPILIAHSAKVTVTSTPSNSTFAPIRMTTDIIVKKYIKEVKHDTNGKITFGEGHVSGDLGATQTAAQRFAMTDAQKQADPVYAEYGDIITYQIDIINEQKYQIKLQLKDILPDKIELISRSFNDKTWLTIPAGDGTAKKVVASYTIVLRTTANDTGEYVNEVKIITRNLPIAKDTNENVNFIKTTDSYNGPVVNIAEIESANNIVSKEYYKINDYNISIDKYVSQYHAEMQIKNNNDAFTDEITELEDRSNKSTSYKQEKPVPVEQSETLVYTIKLTNQSTKGTGNKVATQVRPTQVVDTLDIGIEFQSLTAKIVKSDGTSRLSLSSSTYSADANGSNKQQLNLNLLNKQGNTYVILNPGESLVYEMLVKVTKTNLYLNNLQNKANISILTNINNGKNAENETRVCGTCNGSGKLISYEDCSTCKGTGIVTKEEICSDCLGKGNCSRCSGTGFETVTCEHTNVLYKCMSCGWYFDEDPGTCNSYLGTKECGSTSFVQWCTSCDKRASQCTHYQFICNTCNHAYTSEQAICNQEVECGNTAFTTKCLICNSTSGTCNHNIYRCKTCGYENATQFTVCPNATGKERCFNEMYHDVAGGEWICDKCGYYESYMDSDASLSQGKKCPNMVDVLCSSTDIEYICSNCRKPVNQCNCYEHTCTSCGITIRDVKAAPTKCENMIKCGGTSFTKKCTVCNGNASNCTHFERRCNSCEALASEGQTKCTNIVEVYCKSGSFSKECFQCSGNAEQEGAYTRVCSNCNGTGYALGEEIHCATCNNTGKISIIYSCSNCSDGKNRIETQCGACSGTGHTVGVNASDRIVRTSDGSINRNTNTTETAYEYIKLKDLVIAGKVWLDRNKDGTIGSAGNRTLQTDNDAINVENNPSTYIADNTGKEYAMKGITVKLYKEDGTLVRTTKTDENGMFTFARKEDGTTYYLGEYSRNASSVIESEERIDKATGKDTNKNYTSNSQLINYYVEYEYDGLVYKSTELYAGTTNLNEDDSLKEGELYKYDSNAYELTSVRENFNKKFEIVSFNKATNGDQSTEQILEYDKQNHNSYIVENNDRKITARSFINTDTQTTNYLWLHHETTYDKPETEYLKYINLGLEEREDVDISITQDVYELKTIINGEEMTYEYNQNNYTLGNSAIDKEQEKDDHGNETAYSKAFDSERFITGYKNDTGSVEENKILYNFQYYLEDYNYRVSQYHADTVRAYKGSSLRNFNANAVTNTDSVLVSNSVGRESELNTEITFRIKVTNNAITDDEPFREAEKDIAVYTGINEIVEYYDKDFVNLIFDENGTVKGFNVKTKDSNNYLVNKEIKVVSAKAVMSDGSEKEVILSNNSTYNTTRTIDNYDTLYIRPKISDNALETTPNSSTGQVIKAGNFILGEGDSMDVLVTFTVEKTADTREVNATEAKEIMTILGAKENVAEVSAYSTYYKTGENSYKPASLVDKNSNPGNFGETYGGVSNVDDKEYIKYFEDDTFKTGIQLTIPSTDDPDSETRERDFVQRTLTGFVWDDARSEEAKDDNGTQYIGNGIYTEGHSADKANDAARRNEAVSNKEINDIKVQDVKTELIEVIRMPDPDDPTKERIYEDTIYVNGETGDNASVMTARTDANGKYKFSGYIPGEYIVRFGYGDDASKENMLIFNGQDYKSTTYQGGEAVYAENATENSTNNMTAKDVRLQILEKANTSDAKDDEIRRLEVIGYSETMNNNRNEILKGKNSSNKTELVNNTSMFADTIDFLVRPEKKYEKVTVLKFAEHNKIITEITRYARFKIENIDFGLQYRPELQLALNKYISNITVTTSDTNNTNSTEPLVDAYFDAYYGVVKNTDYKTGATNFVTDDEGNVIEVQANDTVENIENKLGNKKGLAQKNNDGTYVIAVAGTKLNENTSIGLQNVQYLPNEYIKDNDGNQVIEEKDGKYLVKSTQGFAYIVVDDNLLQGSIIKVKYLFTGTNISEIDRIASNLSDLRFKENREVEKYAKTGGTQNQYYDEYTYQVNSINEKPTFIDQHYSAARTARNALFSEYFRYELDANETDQIKKYKNGDKIVYQVKAKDFVASDSNKTIAIQDIKKNPEENNPHSGMTGYYGRYLGSTYYTGKISPEEVVAEIKLDKVLDYIDNDLVFNNDDNRAENNLWKTTTSKELHSDGLLNVFNYTYFDANGKEVSGNTITDNYKLLDADGRAYDTDERSNLALSLDDRVRDDYTEGEEDITVNKEFSKFLLPRDSKSLESFGTISLSASKVLSPEDKTDDMTYENIAEIIQYTSVTGRITNLATTIGNAKIEDVHRKKTESPEFYEGRTESDTASVERVTLTPPTGLSSMNQVVREVVQGASYTVLVLIVVGLVCVGITVGITLYHKRRIK